MRNGVAPPAAAAAVAACLLGVVTWQVVAAGPVTAADIPVHEWVLRHGLDHSSALWVVLGELGDGRVTLPVLVVVAAVTWWRRWALRPLLMAVAALAVSTVALEVMKTAIGRADPGTGADAAFTGGGAFPSGHTFGATVIWGLAAWLAVLAPRPARAAPAPAPARTVPGPAPARPLRPARYVSDRPRVSRYACLIAGGTAGLVSGAAMVRMAYHWVSDVPGGWLLGMITLLAVLAAAESSRWRAQPSGGPPRRTERRPGRDASMPEPPRPERSSTSLARISPPPRAPGGRRSRWR